MNVCKYCGKEFKSGAGLAAHVRLKHEMSSSEKEAFSNKLAFASTKPLVEKEVTCEKCRKQFKRSLNNDQWKKGWPNFCSRSCANSRSMPKTKELFCGKCGKCIIIPYRSRTKLCDSCKPKNTCNSCGKAQKRKSKSGLCKDCISKSESYRANLSKSLKGKTGGTQPGSGRGKSGRYKGIPSDSTWELVYIIYCLDKNKQIDRCKETFDYIQSSGRKAKYHPDFIVNSEIVEIKGPQDKEWPNKLKAVTKPITVIGKNEIDFYIKYVFKEYNVNWKTLTSLYDK